MHFLLTLLFDVRHKPLRQVFNFRQMIGFFRGRLSALFVWNSYQTTFSMIKTCIHVLFYIYLPTGFGYIATDYKNWFDIRTVTKLYVLVVAELKRFRRLAGRTSVFLDNFVPILRVSATSGLPMFNKKTCGKEIDKNLLSHIFSMQ